VMDAGIAIRGARQNVTGGGEEGIRKALALVGTAPEEIDILVLSHLHYDHCGEAYLFRNARVIVQKREWETAFNPVPVLRYMYDQSCFVQLENMELVLVDGDQPIADGVRTLLLPGHTMGNQGLAVSTAKGTAVLTGDQLYSYYNLNPKISEITDSTGRKVAVQARPDLPFIPPGLHANLTDWFDSMWKVISIASSRDLIIPNHEPSLEGKVVG
jgi:N-acyl homoserine lactone hydrolase